MQFPQFVVAVTAANDAEFANVTAEDIRRADVQRYNDGRLVLTLCLNILGIDIALACRQKTWTSVCVAKGAFMWQCISCETRWQW